MNRKETGHLSVLSGYEFNEKSGLLIVCPITSTARGHFFEVLLRTKKTKGVILAYQIRTIDFAARKGKIVDRADKHILKEVIEKINILIDR